MKISKEQQMISIISGIFIGALLIFLIFIYFPAHKKLQEMKREIAQIEADLATFESLRGGRDMGETIRRLESELTALMRTASVSQEKAIKEISETAREQKLEVKNLIVAEKRPYPQGALGFAIDEVPITMNVTGGYRQLGEFLIRLYDGFPVLVRVVRIAISGKGSVSTALEANLQLVVYVKR